MKSYKKTVAFIFFAFSLTFVTSCFNKKEFSRQNMSTEDQINIQTIKVDFEVETPYISELKTEQVIFYPLNVYYYGSVANLEILDKDVSDKISITPKIKGDWKFSDQSTLTFTPHEQWQVGTSYKVDILDKNIFASHIITKLKFAFKTKTFQIYPNKSEFVIDQVDPAQKKAVFTINANIPVNLKSLENRISIKQKKESKELKFYITEDPLSNMIFITTENLPVPDEKTEIVFTIKKGVTSYLGGNEAGKITSTLEIPGALNYASINSSEIVIVKKENFDCEQVLIIETKGKVKLSDMIKNTSIFALPVNMISSYQMKENEKKDFNWENFNPAKIEEFEIIKEAEKVKFENLNEEEYSSTFNFKIDIPENRFIYIHVNKETPFYGNYKLAKDYYDIKKVPVFEKELSIMSEGTVLSLNESKQLPIFSRGIKEVEYSISRFDTDRINHLVSMSNGDMKNFDFKNSYIFNENDIAETVVKTSKILDYSNKELSYFSYNFSDDLLKKDFKDKYSGLFLFSVKEKTNDYWAKIDKRLILVTDLGLYVKTASNKDRHFFVQSVSTGNPLAEAQIELIARNGKTLLTTFTDENGHAFFSSKQIDSVTVKKRVKTQYNPVAYVVKKGSDISFMPYYAKGRTLDYSNYDVGGIYGAEDNDRIFAYLFSDRGIYRPGDKASIGMIFKDGLWKKNLKNTPIEVALVDPNGQEVLTKQMQISENGFEEVNFEIQPYSSTGHYNLSTYLIKTDEDGKPYRHYINGITLKIEEFLPDTMNILSAFEPLSQAGWTNPENLKVNVILRNLFGTPAVENKVSATMELKPCLPYFAKYSQFIFSDPYTTEKNSSYNENLGIKITDEQGRASFDIDISKFEKSTYELDLYIEGFEKGSGRNVSTQNSIYVSPLEYLIGYKSDGDLSYIYKDSKRTLDFIAINPQLKLIDLNEVEISIEEEKYVSSLVKEPNGLYKYQSIQKKYPISTEKINISKNGSKYILPTSKDGEFTLTIKNKEGLNFNTIKFSVIGSKNVSRSLTRTAELNLKLEKSDLRKGEEAKIFIQAPYAGSGLITIERDNVYKWKWFKISQTEDGIASGIQTITIPYEIEGNGYISVMFERSSTSKEIYMSPFCYASIPFTINKEDRTNRIKLNVPEKIKPSQDLPITYSSDKPGKAIIFCVDKGILQAANYKMPDPISYFFQKRALEVKTDSIMDLILPDYQVVKSVAASGGGIFMKNKMARNLNPFKRKENKSVVFWSGIVDIDSNKRTLNYKVPQYFNGQLDIMAVSVSQNNIGTANEKTIVQSNYVIQANSPTVASPKDEFEISLTVTNNKKGSGNAKITLNAICSKHFEILSNSSFELTIPEGKDAVAKFNVKTSDQLGSAQIEFIAKDNEESTNYTQYLSVRPPMPYQVMLSCGYLTKGDISIKTDKNLYDEYAQREINLSYLPLSIAKGLNFYLQEYPYGCSEQITSAAYPMLFPELLKEMNFDDAKRKEIVMRTISILQTRVKDDGNIGYWTYKSEKNELLTAYIGEFLTHAKSCAYPVPTGFMNSTLKALRENAQTSENYYARAYSIYVLTLNEEITTSYIEKLQEDMKKNHKDSDYTKIYLAASYSLMKQKEKAEKLINSVVPKINPKDDDWCFINNLSIISAYLEIKSKYFSSSLDKNVSEKLIMIADEVAGENYGTFSACAALKAVNQYIKVMPNSINDNLSLSQTIAGETKPILPVQSKIMSASFDKNAEKVSITNKEKQHLFYQLTQAGYEKDLPTKELKNNIEINKEYLSKDGKKLSTFDVGDYVTVKISFRLLNGKKQVENLIIADLLPSGFEPDIESIRKNGTGDWKSDYIDIREDRVLFFGTATDSLTTFYYQVRAINKGKFTVPPAYAQAMYDKTIKALKPVDSITIE
ncbi:MAG: alpha-2-macroglobulin family protein [Treponemataceae bacterium]